jgi:hypothetical protein
VASDEWRVALRLVRRGGLAQDQHPGRMLRGGSRLWVASMRHLTDDTLLVITSQGKRGRIKGQKQRKDLDVLEDRTVPKWHSWGKCEERFLAPLGMTAGGAGAGVAVLQGAQRRGSWWRRGRTMRPRRFRHGAQGWLLASTIVLGHERDRKPHLSRRSRENGAADRRPGSIIGQGVGSRDQGSIQGSHSTGSHATGPSRSPDLCRQ